MSKPTGTIQDRIAGALLGVTIGDTLGAPLEFKSPAAIKAKWGVHRDIEGVGTFGHQPGEGTDDSDLTFAVSRAYRDGFTLERVADNFIAWQGGGPRDIGGATASGIGQLRALRRRAGSPDLTTAGGRGENSCGNGSLMRTVAVGLAEQDPELRLRRARDVSALTHAHPRCTEACATYSELVGLLVEGEEPALAYGRVRSRLIARSLEVSPDGEERGAFSDVVNAFKEGWEVVDENPADPDAGLSRLDTSGYVLAGLRLSTWALRRSLDVGPEQALIEVVNRGGDADTNGAIVGGLLGAAYGTEVWPERWVEKLSYRDEALATAPALEEIRTYPHGRWLEDVDDPGEQLFGATGEGGTLDVDELLSAPAVGATPGIDPEPVEKRRLWRRLLGLGPSRAPRSKGALCGKWMPISRTRCVLPAGHPDTTHCRSVL